MAGVPDSNPKIYVIAGPNGAGKTTFAGKFLPELAECKEFLNADLIAAGLSPFAPEGQAILASQLLLQRMNKLVDNRQSFSFETTLAAKAYRSAILRWKDLGVSVCLFFLWLPSAELAVERVASRVREGGHFIPENVVRRRFARGLNNLFQIYLNCVDEVKIFDASQLVPEKIWERTEQLDRIVDPAKWDELVQMKVDLL